jgi:hypothetical protein
MTLMGNVITFLILFGGGMMLIGAVKAKKKAYKNPISTNDES